MTTTSYFYQKHGLVKKTSLNLDINGYFCEHLFGTKAPGSSKGSYSGGLSIYAKHYLKDKLEIIDKNSNGLLWLKLSAEQFSFNENVYICCVYIPPSDSRIFRTADFNYWDEIEKGIELYSNLEKAFITGDMNGRISSLSDVLDFDKYLENDDLFIDISQIHPRSNKDSILDSHGRKLLDLCKSTSFIVANGRLGDDCNVGELTYCSAQGISTVDYLLVPATDLSLIHTFQVLSFNEFSDHAPLFFSFACYKPNFDSFTNETGSKTKERIFWDATNETLFLEKLRENYDVLLTNDNSDASLNDKATPFSSLLAETSMNVFGKFVKTRTCNSPTRKKIKSVWFNEECENARKDFARTRNSFLKHKNDATRQEFVRNRTKYNRIKTKAKKLYKRKEGQKLDDAAKKQPRKFWKKIKSLQKSKKACGKNLKIDDLFEHFRNMFANDADSQSENYTEENDILDPDLDLDISMEELKKAVFHQKNNKSYGLNNICTEVLKSSFVIISPFLLKLINQIFNSGEYPESWGRGIIVPIFKSGDANLAQNYRVITISNILSKVYSQVLLNRMTKWADMHDVMNNAQFGFKKGKSTTDCIFILHSITSKLLSSKQKLYCVFIDFEKAFDKIDRLKLWHKLILENVGSKMVRALQAMYSTVKA